MGSDEGGSVVVGVVVLGSIFGSTHRSDILFTAASCNADEQRLPAQTRILDIATVHWQMQPKSPSGQPHWKKALVMHVC